MHQFLKILDGEEAAFEPYVAFDEQVFGDDHSVKVNLFHFIVFNGLVPVQSFDTRDAAIAAAKEFNRRHREARLPKLLWRKLTCRWLRAHAADAWLIEVVTYILTGTGVETRTSYEISLPERPSISCDSLGDAESHLKEHERLTDERLSASRATRSIERDNSDDPNGSRGRFTP
jgi:hypothetical protein